MIKLLLCIIPFMVYCVEPSLKSLAIQKGMEIGSAVRHDQLDDESYRSTLVKEFTLLIPEYEMYFDIVHPQELKWNFEWADKIVDFAKKNCLTVRGHTLVWHRQIPDWIQKKGIDRRAILCRHITNVLGHFHGAIDTWHVVNEAIDDEGEMRESIWWEINEDPQNDPFEYIALAFTWASEADCKAKLFYNDYNSYTWSPDEKIRSGQHKKADKIYEMVKHLRREGIPIHGIGLQMHLRCDQPPNLEAIRHDLDRFTKLGLEVNITEMDVAIGLHGEAPTAKQLEAQAKIYRDVLQVYLKHTNPKLFAMWGFTDKATWIPEWAPHDYKGYGAPLIFDEEYKPKSAYFSLFNSLAF